MFAFPASGRGKQNPAYTPLRFFILKVLESATIKGFDFRIVLHDETGDAHPTLDNI